MWESDSVAYWAWEHRLCLGPALEPHPESVQQGMRRESLGDRHRPHQPPQGLADPVVAEPAVITPRLSAAVLGEEQGALALVSTRLEPAAR